jgi:GNAT superfamily N-acetyltransferase
VTEIEIRPMRYGSAVVKRLVEQIFADQVERYGSADETVVESMEFDPPDGGFLVAYSDGQPVGCAGWRSHGDTDEIAELKRLFCTAEARGTGVATALVAAIEANARDHGRKRMILEPGDRQPEAIALYAKLGYERIEDFGTYAGYEGVRSFGKHL